MKKSFQNIFRAFELSILTLSLIFAQAAKQSITVYLPQPNDLGTWRQVDSTRVFSGDDLFTLIDGGADIYFEYGFQQVAAAEYQNNHEKSIKLEIYEMSDASAAYGMFSLNAGNRGKKVQIGNEGMLSEYYLMFWKNSFLVFLTGADTTSETTSGILAMAAAIDQRLGAPGAPPILVSFLPKDSLRSCTFVRGPLGLSSFYTFDTKNIFGVKEGVVGSYPTHTLFIFQYDSDKEAEENFIITREVLKTNSRYSDFKQVDGRCTMTDQKGVQLCITFLKNHIVVVLSTKKNNILEICDDATVSLHRR